MHANPSHFSRRRSQGALSRIASDRRRHKRIEVMLFGRFMRAKHPCRLLVISTGGLVILSPVHVADGERVIAYFDHIGGIEGSVARCFNGGFAIKSSTARHNCEKLSAQLMWRADRSERAVVRQHVQDFGVASCRHPKPGCTASPLQLKTRFGRGALAPNAGGL